MGVGSLFTYLSLIPNCATIVDLLSFGRGLTIGLDASCWLHALCHNPNVAKQLVFMNRVDALVHGFVERCQRLHEHGIILRVVFDGPAPAGKCSKSARTGRDANSKTLLRIRSQIRSGAAAESIPISDVEKAARAALKALASTFSPDIAAQLRARGIGMCIRAREEADTQLAMECFCGAVDAVLTADSDFILLGSPIVLQMYHGDPVWTSWSRGGPVRVRVFNVAAALGTSSLPWLANRLQRSEVNRERVAAFATAAGRMRARKKSYKGASEEDEKTEKKTKKRLVISQLLQRRLQTHGLWYLLVVAHTVGCDASNGIPRVGWSKLLNVRVAPATAAADAGRTPTAPTATVKAILSQLVSSTSLAAEMTKFERTVSYFFDQSVVVVEPAATGTGCTVSTSTLRQKLRSDTANIATLAAWIPIPAERKDRLRMAPPLVSPHSSVGAQAFMVAAVSAPQRALAWSGGGSGGAIIPPSAVASALPGATLLPRRVPGQSQLEHLSSLSIVALKTFISTRVGASIPGLLSRKANLISYADAIMSTEAMFAERSPQYHPVLIDPSTGTAGAGGGVTAAAAACLPAPIGAAVRAASHARFVSVSAATQAKVDDASLGWVHDAEQLALQLPWMPHDVVYEHIGGFFGFDTRLSPPKEITNAIDRLEAIGKADRSGSMRMLDEGEFVTIFTCFAASQKEYSAPAWARVRVVSVPGADVKKVVEVVCMKCNGKECVREAMCSHCTLALVAVAYLDRPESVRLPSDASTDAWIHDGWQWKGGAGPTLCVTSPTSVLSWQGKRAGREQAVRGSAATGRSEFDPTPRAPAFDPTSPRTMAQLRVVWDLACEALGDVASAHEAAYAPHFDLPIRSAAAPPRSPPPPPPPAKSPAPRATPRTRARQRRKGRKVAAGSAGGSPRRVATAGGARGGTPTSAERRSAGRHSRARPVAPAAYASGTAMDLDDALARADDVHI